VRSIGKRDLSESSIVRTLRSLGAVVVLHNGKDEPDLFVLLRGRWHALEVKLPKGARGGASHSKLSRGQAIFQRVTEAAGLPVIVVRTPEEALAAVGIETLLQGAR
jgi:hypothetical protein